MVVVVMEGLAVVGVQVSAVVGVQVSAMVEQLVVLVRWPFGLQVGVLFLDDVYGQA